MLVSCEGTGGTASNGYMFGKSEIRLSPTRMVNDGYWDAPMDLEGEHHIVVDTELQKATYYIAGRAVGISPISSGKAGHGTPSGEFKVLDKDAEHKSSTYGSIVDAEGNTLVADYTKGQPIPAGGIYKGADMNNALKITNSGIWMHEGIVTAAPESHGCIRLPKDMAKIFFDNTPVGTRITIK